MKELEITARELILAIMEKTLKSLKNNGLLKEPSKLQSLCSSPEIMSLIKKLSPTKYDPNRKFRSGDKVRSKQVNGRWYSSSDKEYAGYLLTVMGEEGTEDADTVVYVAPNDKTSWATDPAYLELVVPVEKLERFHVCQDEEMECFEVYKNEYTESAEDYDKEWKIARTTYFYGDNRGLRTLAEAKEAAEAECDRLNAEHRKELEND